MYQDEEKKEKKKKAMANVAAAASEMARKRASQKDTAKSGRDEWKYEKASPYMQSMGMAGKKQ